VTVAPTPLAGEDYRPAQIRVLDAAAELFAQHGVGGTSLQMIADALGVTKGAIYFQFKSKDEVVLAVAEAELARLEAALTTAEAEPTRARARAMLVIEIVDLAVESRRRAGTLLSEPVIVGHFAHHQPFRQVMDRLYRLLAGDDPTPEARLRAAMLTAALAGAATHPLATELDDDTLRSELRNIATSVLHIDPALN
jgi:AcrR family transcriptional regulator